MSIQFLCPFFNWAVWDLFLMLNCMSYLYILNINPLSVFSFANVFSYFTRPPFCFVNGFLCCAESLLNLIRSYLFIFAFISFALGDGSKKILLRFMSHSALPCFPLEILILMRQHSIREESTGQWMFHPIVAYLSPTLTYGCLCLPFWFWMFQG